MGRIVTKSLVLLTLLAPLVLVCDAGAREVEYKDSEVDVFVNPGEPTQIQFPSKISGGFKKKLSALSIDRKDDSLILFATDNIQEAGEAIIVRLEDGRSYSLRVARATDTYPRDAFIRIKDDRGALLAYSDEEEPAYKEKTFEYAPPSQVSGLVREMVLLAEFGKKAITGYKVSEDYQGQPVMNDGTLVATIDKILIGPNLWGYILDAKNLLDTSQRLNPASFRLDGTRAVSARNWELA
ncbi:MAG: hypothetical protein DCC75_11080, partial [Proteobacteria bacterium]